MDAAAHGMGLVRKKHAGEVFDLDQQEALCGRRAATACATRRAVYAVETADQERYRATLAAVHWHRVRSCVFGGLMPILFPLLHAPTWRHFRYWAVLLLAFSSFIPISEAAPTGMVSFDETLRLAVERAPSLNARQSQTQAAREEAIRAAALPDPQLTFGLDNWPVTGAQAFDWRAEDMTMKRIGLMQEFPARAKRQARQAVADRAVEQAEALSVTEQLAVRQVAASAWITLWAAEREQEVLSSQREQSALGIRLAEARLASGVGTAAEALAVQAAGLDLENRIDAARAKVEAARGTLARWLGSDPSEVGTVGVPPDLATLPIDAATCQRQLKTDPLEVRLITWTTWR